MLVTAEISLYPLTNDYEAVIIPLLENLQSRSDVRVFTNAMSTYIQGDWSHVMACIQEDFGLVMQQEPKKSLVIKILNSAAPIEEGWLRFV
jgi:uncharacterized protein YqgV (UPF0045/DUF77 family)